MKDTALLDIFRMWVATKPNILKSKVVDAEKACTEYHEWCSGNGFPVVSQIGFGKMMTRGFRGSMSFQSRIDSSCGARRFYKLPGMTPFVE